MNFKVCCWHFKALMGVKVLCINTKVRKKSLFERKKINGFQEDGTRSRQRRDLAAEDRVLPAEAVSPAERPGKVRCWLGHQEAADWSLSEDTEARSLGQTFNIKSTRARGR